MHEEGHPQSSQRPAVAVQRETSDFPHSTTEKTFPWEIRPGLALLPKTSPESQETLSYHRGTLVRK